MSSVKDVIPLRESTGAKSTGGQTFSWLFKVTTYSDFAGPLQVLDAFPIGQTLQAYISAQDWVDKSKYGFPLHYRWPGFDRCNNDVGWDTSKFYTTAHNCVVTSVSIVDRGFQDDDQIIGPLSEYQQSAEGQSKQNRAWYVNVTFTQTDDNGPDETPVITETLTDVSEPAFWGEYKGEYNRIKGDNPDNIGNTKWSDPLNLDNPLHEERNENDHCMITNSAGIPYLPPLKKRKTKKVITCTWVCPFALDFSRAIGKVNCNKVTLIGVDNQSGVFTGGDQTDEAKFANWSAGNFGFSKQYVVYNQTFSKRTLLIQDVSCSLFTVFGRDFYRYTAVLLHDVFEHDVFLLDQGFEILQDSSWDDPDTGPQTLIRGANTKAYNQTPRVPVKDLTGMQSNEPSLLNGKGRLLMESNPNDERKNPSGDGLQGSTENAVWLRWAVKDSVLFSLPYDPTSGYKRPEEISEVYDLDCPLMWSTTNFTSILKSDINPLDSFCVGVEEEPTE